MIKVYKTKTVAVNASYIFMKIQNSSNRRKLNQTSVMQQTA